MSNRNDQAITANRPEYMPLLEQAQRTGSVRNLPKLPNFYGYYCTTRTTRRDGTQRVHLKYFCKGQSITLGSYLVQAIDRRFYTPAAVPVGKIINLACGRQVRIAIDHHGLPVPLPVELTP